MKLTALDIRKQDFVRVLRGYDPDEVQAFLQTVAGQWEEVQDDLRRLEERAKEFEVKLRHYERVEVALDEALRSARESSKEAMANAEQKAARIIADAENDADDLLRSAEEERRRMGQDIQTLRRRRVEIAARLRAFLSSELELLGHYEKGAAEVERDIPEFEEEETRANRRRRRSSSSGDAQPSAASVPDLAASEPEPAPEPEVEPEPEPEPQKPAGEIDKLRRILDDLE